MSPFTVKALPAVFVAFPEKLKLLYVVPRTDCEEVELKSTVLGVVVVTSNVPALNVKLPAIPKMEPVPS
jgi:hypothetical protein